MRRWTIINVLLGTLAVLLGVEIVRTWGRTLPAITPPRQAQPAASSSRRTGADRETARATLPPEAMVTTIAEKDLFDPTRRAADGEPTATSEPVREVGPPPGVTLVGVRIVGDDREAFITEATSGNRQRRLREGDQVGTFTVQAIEPAGVTLGSEGGDVVTLELELEKAVGKRSRAKRGGSPAAGANLRKTTTTTVPRRARPPRRPPRQPARRSAPLGDVPGKIQGKLKQLRQSGAVVRRPSRG